jgi:hypothetical protein
MAAKRKILLIVLIAGALLSATLLSVPLFYYYQPSKTKSLLEQSISIITGAVCTIRELSYSVSPLEVRAKGISVLDHIHGFDLEIPEFLASMSLKGPFGRKTLTFTSFTLQDFSFTARPEMGIGQSEESEGNPSLLARLLKALASAFLFKDVKFQAMHVSDGYISLDLDGPRATFTDVTASVTPDHLLEIVCSGKVEIPSEEIVAVGRQVRLSSDQVLSLVQPEIEGSLTIQGVSFSNPLIVADDVFIRSGIVYSHEKKTLSFQPLEIRCNGLHTTKHAQGVEVPSKAVLSAEASLDLTKHRVEARRFHFTLQDMLECDGTAEFDYEDHRNVKIKDMDGHGQFKNLLSLMPDSMKKPLGPLKLAGPIRWKGGLGAYEREESWRWSCDVQVQLDQNEFSYVSSGISSQGVVSGEFREKGEFPEVESSLNLNAEPLSFQSEWTDFKSGRLELSLKGRRGLLEILGFSLNIPEQTGLIGGKEVSIKNVGVKVETGSVDVEKRTLFVPDMEIKSSSSKKLSISLRRDERELAVSIKGNDMHLAESAQALNLIPAGWKWASRDSLDAGLSLKKNGEWKASSRISLEGANFENSDSTIAGARISLNLVADLSGNLNSPLYLIGASLKARDGEILLHRLYLDLNKSGFSFAMDGTYDQRQKSLSLSSAEFGLKDLFSVEARGTLLQVPEHPVADLSVSIPETPLKPVFQQFLQETFRQDYPLLSDLDVKGNFSADLELQGQVRDPMVRGRLRWDDGGVRSLDDTFSFEGISLDLPLWYEAGARKGPRKRKMSQGLKPKDEKIKGGLTIDSAKLPLFPGQALSLEMEATPDQWTIPSPTLLKVPGGEVELGSLVVKNPYSASPSMRTSLSFKNLELNGILSRIWRRRVDGIARGRLNPVEFRGDRIATNGEIKAGIFGGMVAVSDPGVDHLFSPSPILHLDAKWNDLSLFELTKGTPFGEVQGVLQGHLKGLEIAGGEGGEPQKFDLLLETVPRDSVPQRISVKAVDNIAQIGGGQNAFRGIAGIVTSFFKDFPYEKIGVHATLENDMFRINGTIKEGGIEYLVKRGSFSGVNVVNENPDNKISFKDMVKRIKRVTASGGEVVVK